MCPAQGGGAIFTLLASLLLTNGSRVHDSYSNGVRDGRVCVCRPDSLLDAALYAWSQEGGAMYITSSAVTISNGSVIEASTSTKVRGLAAHRRLTCRRASNGLHRSLPHVGGHTCERNAG